MTGLIFDIKHYCIHDGPGIRTTVFFKGCPLRCWWCHNPESQELTEERVTVEHNLDEKRFTSTTTLGKRLTVQDVMAEIEKDMVFYQESGGGVSFSGGEPLMQPEFLAEVLTACKAKGIHTVVDTCGYAEPAALDRIIDSVDLWLFDVKVMEDVKHLEYTGLSNDLILKNLVRLAESDKQVIARLPVIPDTTDTLVNIMAVSRSLKAIGIRRIDLLPYHAIAREKYHKLGKEFLMGHVKEPDKKTLEFLKTYFQDEGFDVG